LLVEAVDRFFSLGPIDVLDEGKSAGTAGVAIHGNDDLRRITYRREMRAEVRLSGPVGHIANEQTYCCHGRRSSVN
jgi:hypothetical protein